ncbi:uncharacterized protein LOC125190345 [Salvia hispanica]|uniref:uncharacterized protein LOC125190345 n=1 Tax=Salvia hispanica TaxID=49212 RepID=UPI0020099DAF|nr:uncharacterized protein LOC125190345 [Salvia hispanica]
MLRALFLRLAGKLVSSPSRSRLQLRAGPLPRRLLANPAAEWRASSPFSSLSRDWQPLRGVPGVPLTFSRRPAAPPPKVQGCNLEPYGLKIEKDGGRRRRGNLIPTMPAFSFLLLAWSPSLRS